MPSVELVKTRSMQGQSPSMDAEYLVEGYATQAAADAALAAAAPSYWGALVRQSFGTDQVGDGSRFWNGTVRYGPATYQAQHKTGDRVLRGSTGGATKHITKAYQHLSDHAPAGETATNHEGLINVRGQGRDKTAEGCDVPARQHEFSITWYVPAVEVTQAYLDAVDAASGCANLGAATLRTDSVTLTYAEGELLFVGCQYSQRGDEDWEFVFNFRVIRNVEDETLDGAVEAIPLVRGQDYLWVEPMLYDDTAAHETVLAPAYAHLEQVVPYVDMTVLNLHT